MQSSAGPLSVNENTPEAAIRVLALSAGLVFAPVRQGGPGRPEGQRTVATRPRWGQDEPADSVTRPERRARCARWSAAVG